MTPTTRRGNWASRLGFVLAAAGSAVGLGNIWKFPYITGVYGGGAFVLVYLVCILLVGLPIMWAELAIGKLAQRDPVGAFRRLEGPDTPWQLLGWMGVASAFVILSFYSVVAGWALAFVFRALIGAIAHAPDPSAVKAIFERLVANPEEQVFWHLLFMGLTVGIVSAGVHRGLERWSEILMPGLFLLLLGLLGYSLTLEGFGQGWRFLFHFDASQLTPQAVLEALGHAFFTLSLGMGAMITYGSYLRPEVSIERPGFSVVALDTVIALMAGLVIFPIVFHFGLEAGAGPGLIFKTLPVAFHDLPGGTLVAVAFFTLLTFAALTSAISLLEVAVAFFCDELGWDRRVAALVIGFAIFLLGVPSAYFGSFFDLMDRLSTNYLLPLGGLGISLYTGWVLDRQLARRAFGRADGFFRAWLWLVRWVSPLLVAAVFLYKIGVFTLS